MLFLELELLELAFEVVVALALGALLEEVLLGLELEIVELALLDALALDSEVFLLGPVLVLDLEPKILELDLDVGVVDLELELFMDFTESADFDFEELLVELLFLAAELLLEELVGEDLPCVEVDEIGGCSFGCVLSRRACCSVLRNYFFYHLFLKM